MESLGVKAIAIRTDVTLESDVVALFEQTEATLGGIDILVSNAGIQMPRSIVDSSVDDWDRMM